MFKISVVQRLILAGMVTLLPAATIFANDLPAGAVSMGSTGSIGTLDMLAAHAQGTAQDAVAADQATTDNEAPVVQQQGSIKYITGGIGDEERDAFKAAASQYNLHITSATVTGEYLGDAQVAIRDQKGHQLLSATAGPLFFAAVPTGKYTVEVTNGGSVKKQIVTLGSKAVSLHFHW